MLSQAEVSAFLAYGDQPRIIAQPGVALHEEYSLHERPGERPPPVQ